MMITVLDIGSNIGNVDMMEGFIGDRKGLKITRLDIYEPAKPDVLHDITTPLPDEHRGKYDVVFSSHMLEHIERKHVINSMRHLISGVKNHGEVWIVVPSLEWCANQIVEHRNNQGVQGLIYGGQQTGNIYDVHKCGFTLHDLRHLMELCGLVIKRAFQSEILVSVDGGQYIGVQNVCVGVRVDELIEEPRPEGENHVESI